MKGLHARLAALLLVALLTIPAGFQSVHAAGSGMIQGIPHQGAVGVPERNSDIMRRQAALSASGAAPIDQEKEIEQPDRGHLKPNPLSPEVASIPELPASLKAEIDKAQIEGRNPRPLSPQVVSTNFTAATLSGANPTNSFPPDCMGAVGPTQYVVFVNGRLVTFNKNTGAGDGVLNADPDNFFLSVRNGSRTSDPRIRYDRLSGRWFLIIINVATPNRILFAVSDAASNGTISAGTVWTYFFINIATTPPAISSTCLADYPTLGIDANALYIGTNNFCGTPTQTFNSTDGYVVRKSSIMGAGPIVVTAFRGLVANASATGPYTPQGVDNYDPASNEGFFIGVDAQSYGLLQMVRIATPGATPSKSANIPITVAATNAPLNVPHLGNTGGTSGYLSSIDDRLFAAHIRNGMLWTAQNVGVNNTGVSSGTLTRNGSRWYQFSVPAGSGTPTNLQTGTLFTATASNLTDQLHYFVPSVMVSGQGHVAMSLTTAGTNARANAATVGRLSGDASSTMETPVFLTSSATAYNPPSDPGGANGRRWGDYSYVSLDPLDDQTMWSVNMFCNTTNQYGVQVSKLLSPPPATPSSAPDVTAGANPVTITLTGLSTSGSGFWDPGTNLPGVPAFRHLSAAVTNGGATGTPPAVVSATYVNPTTVTLVLNAAGATANIGVEKYTVSITNPDGQVASGGVIHVIGSSPVATIAAGPSTGEGNAGNTPFNFTVNLSSAAASPVVVRYSTSDGTATVADNDYVAATDSITIGTGLNSGTIAVQVKGDTKFETNETFGVTLTSVTNATLGGTVNSTGTIVNDDAQPVVSVAGPAATNEGNSGTTAFGFTVSLSNASYQAISVTAQTADSTATAADSDYVSNSGTVNIPAGQLTAPFSVNVKGDTKLETDEAFKVALSAPANATLGAANSVGTIINDDVAPTVSVNNVTLSEGNAGTTSFTFAVSLSQASGLPAAVDYFTQDGTALVSNNDYQGATGTLNFAPGDLSKPVTILVNGDLTQEPDELFTLNLTNLVGMQAGTVQGIGTILNDDGAPTISITGVSRAEGNAGNTTFVFPVALSNPSAQTITVHYQASDSTATVAGNDYLSASGTITFLPGSVLDSAQVSVVGDSCGEPNEFFKVDLSAPTGAAISTGRAVGTIVNDDDVIAPSVAVTSPNGGEILVIGNSANITWTASDNTGVSTVDIALSRDAGQTYPEVLATGIPNTGTFGWTVTGPNTFSPGGGIIQIVVHDFGCNSTRDTSDAVFQIGTSATAVGTGGPIKEFALNSIRPNPSSGQTRIAYQLPRDAQVKLSVLNVQGREVAVLYSGHAAAGRYVSEWSGATGHGTAAAGVYFVRYEAGGKQFTRRLVLVR